MKELIDTLKYLLQVRYTQLYSEQKRFVSFKPYKRDLEIIQKLQKGLDNVRQVIIIYFSVTIIFAVLTIILSLLWLLKS